MLLISSTWDGQPTFKMIPACVEAPYSEVIFDPSSGTLAIVAKEKKQTLHMLPKLDETGDVVRLKVKKRENGKEYAETRVSMETFYEYFIEKKEEILDFVAHFAINADKVDAKSIIENAFTEKPAPSILAKPQIITEA
jgi:hypothetical protein